MKRCCTSIFLRFLFQGRLFLQATRSSYQGHFEPLWFQRLRDTFTSRYLRSSRLSPHALPMNLLVALRHLKAFACPCCARCRATRASDPNHTIGWYNSCYNAVQLVISCRCLGSNLHPENVYLGDNVRGIADEQSYDKGCLRIIL